MSFLHHKNLPCEPGSAGFSDPLHILKLGVETRPARRYFIVYWCVSVFWEEQPCSVMTSTVLLLKQWVFVTGKRWEWCLSLTFIALQCHVWKDKDEGSRDLLYPCLCGGTARSLYDSSSSASDSHCRRSSEWTPQWCEDKVKENLSGGRNPKGAKDGKMKKSHIIFMKMSENISLFEIHGPQRNPPTFLWAPPAYFVKYLNCL